MAFTTVLDREFMGSVMGLYIVCSVKAARGDKFVYLHQYSSLGFHFVELIIVQ